jgi:hypothetical protein
MASVPPSHRASLLSSLRTGGVRSSPMVGVPHTAAPGASFDISSHFAGTYNQPSFREEDDQLSDLLSQNMYINQQQRTYQLPNTAAVDGSVNMFAQQQAHFANGLAPGMANPNSALGSAPLHAHAQQQALQIQLMQLELIRMQVCSPLPCYPLFIADFLSRLCKPSNFKPDCLLRIASRMVDNTCPPQRPVP